MPKQRCFASVPAAPTLSSSFRLCPSPLWLLQVLRHIYSGAVDEAEHQLRIDSQHEHDCESGQQSEPLSDRQIWKLGPSLIERSGENTLENGQNEDRSRE